MGWTIERSRRADIPERAGLMSDDDLFEVTIVSDGLFEITMLTVPGPDGRLIGVDRASDEMLIAHAEAVRARVRA